MRRFFVALAILMVLALGGSAVARSRVFGLRRLSVSGVGAAFVTERGLGLSARTSLLLLSQGEVAASALRLDPWASGVSVRISLPHLLVLVLSPRRPLALVQAGAVAWALTQGAMVLPATPAQRRTLPYITGVVAPERAMAVDPNPTLAAALAVAAALPASILPDVSEIHAIAGGQAFELVLMDGRPVMVGPAVALAAKLRLLPALVARYPWPEYAGTGFDLRDPNRPSLYSTSR